jgi:glycosyltransferase involved in cell wall biosynthesis
MAKTSILFISTQLPYPPKSGGTIKSWNYLSHLATKYNIGLACLLKEDDREHLDAFKTKLSFRHLLCEDLEVPRNFFSLVGSYLFSYSLNLYRNRSASFKRKINAIAAEYEVIIIDHYEMAQYVPNAYQGKVVIHTHNAEFALWKRMGELSSNPLIKLALKIEAARVKRYERKCFEKADLVYATPSDIEAFKAAGIDSNNFEITYHLGNTHLLSLPKIEFEKTEKSMIFMGTLSWEPNIDGLIWFIQNAYPKILAAHHDVKLYVLGKQTDDRLANIAKNYPSIKLCGFIQDINEYLEKCRVFIAPLRFGSGMKVKVLEGMYRGLPMVTTDIGAEGLEVDSNKQMLISDDAETFAQQCIQLLEDQKLWERLRDSSRELAANKYTWEPLFKSMDSAIEKL